MWLKQSTAVTVKMGPFLDSVDGNTQETALTISQADIRLSKNGGAYAQTNNAAGATHDAAGNYGVPLDTTDTNTLGTLRVAIHETGALAVWQDFMVVPANVWDSLFGADALQVHANEITAGLITAAAIATGAIDADALATDAVAEIADGVWDEAKAGHTTATTFGDLATDLDTVAVDVAGLDGAAMRGTDNAALASVCTAARLAELDAANLPADVDAILVDTGTTLDGRIPAALVSGRIDASVGAIAVGVDLSATMKASVNTEVDSALDTAIPGVPTGDSINQRVRSMDLLTEAAGAGDLAAVLTDTADMQPKLGTPAGASVSADVAAVKVDTAAILVDTGTTLDGRIPAALVGGRMDSNMQAAATAVIAAGTFAAGAMDAAALAADAGNEIADAVKGRTLTEGYAADGAAPTLEQALLMLISRLFENAIAGTTLTAKKLNGTTTSMTFTLDDATNPTSITRAT